ncbi:glycosyltransferase family 2 protein [Pelagibacterales bacterium SAG-MED21]|nr:glycosyltransferase family 2 protein [Pelagibacterales bacterium SAG-MED21]
MQSKRNLLFIPAFNCRSQLVRLIANLKIDDIKNYEKILIIDNCSEDRTCDYAKEAVERKKFTKFKIIRNISNYGLGGSHKIAFKYAIENNFDFCCVIHGDDQGDINDLNRVIVSGEYNNYTCLRAGRFKPGSKLKGYSNFRIFGNHVFRIIYSMILRKNIYDIGAGLATYKMEEVRKIKFEKFVNDMSFDSFMILVFDFYKLKFDFFNVTWKEEDQISNTNLFKTATKILENLVKYKLNKEKFIKKFYTLNEQNYKYETVLEN